MRAPLRRTPSYTPGIRVSPEEAIQKVQDKRGAYGARGTCSASRRSDEIGAAPRVYRSVRSFVAGHQTLRTH